MFKSPLFWLIVLLIVILTLTFLAPVEMTLGSNARIVYLHGAWVWGALATILASGAAGLAGLLLRRPALHRWSRGLGQAGLLLWGMFLLMSLYVMQANWNGLFLDEPRFRVPLNFAIVGLLLQVGLLFYSQLALSSAANLAFAMVLTWGMRSMGNVLHPISPVFNSESLRIQAFFLALLVAILLLAWQLSRWLLQARWNMKV